MEYIKYILSKTLIELKKENLIFENDAEIFLPSLDKFGDFSSNVALKNAKINKLSPYKLALKIKEHIVDYKNYIKDIKIEGPGFLNFYLNNNYYKDLILNFLSLDFKQSLKKYKDDNVKLILEFVSANPTGPLNIVNARAACYGDIISNIYKLYGYKVFKEYYVNDWGGQIEKLIDSVILKLQVLKGKLSDQDYLKKAEENTLYKGDYITDLSKKLYVKYKDNENYDRNFIAKFCIESIIKNQKEDLQTLKVEFDNWYKQSDLFKNRLVSEVVKLLEDKGFVYSKDSALWFKSTLFGDDKDRVLVRKNGMPTYFAFDIAYHYDKIKRGFNYLLDYLGPDHHGYINRLKGVVKALGFDNIKFDIDIIQLVTLIKDKKKVKMSKREGVFISLNDLLKKVDADIVRYFFTTLNRDTHLNFDIDLALLKSEENPLYYIQYAYARLSSIIDKINTLSMVKDDDINSEYITKEDIKILKKIQEFFVIFNKSVEDREVSYLNRYFYELASVFHFYYSKNKIIVEDKRIFSIRYSLILILKKLFSLFSFIFNINLPERM